MADSVNREYIYPPNWDTNPMALNENNYKKYIVNFSNYSDGTGETDAIKIDPSGFKTVNGKQATRLRIDKIEYRLQGMGVKLEFDRAPRKLVKIINCGSDGSAEGVIEGPFIDDGESGDRTGNLLLTTLEAANLDSYDLTIHFRVKE